MGNFHISDCQQIDIPSLPHTLLSLMVFFFKFLLCELKQKNSFQIESELNKARRNLSLHMSTFCLELSRIVF